MHPSFLWSKRSRGLVCRRHGIRHAAGFKQRQRIVRMLQVGNQVIRGPPGYRLMLGYLMMVLSKSARAWENRAADQPLSSPAYLPGEVFRPAVSAFVSCSPRCTGGLIGFPIRLRFVSYGNHRHDSDDSGPPAGPRFNIEPAMHQMDPLLHTHQTQATISSGRFQVEAGTRITPRLYMP